MAVLEHDYDAQTRIHEFASGVVALEQLEQVEENISFQNAQRIGSGSLGDVLHVTDRLSLQPLALKVISRSKVNTRGVGEDRLRREVQVMSELNHPNVVKIVDVLVGLQQLPCVSAEPPFLCIAMELIDASWPLSYEIRRSGAQPDLVTKVLPQLASALSEIHAKGIVHRDVWSENVLINKDEHIVLCDLGCAESTAGPTVSRNLNIPYLSPQAARCEKQHPSDDVWAAGLLVTEMVTGLFVLQRIGRTDIPMHKVPGALSQAIAETQAVAGQTIGLLTPQLLDLGHEQRPTMPEVSRALEGLEGELTEVIDKGPPQAQFPVLPTRCSTTPMRNRPINTSQPMVPVSSPPPVVTARTMMSPVGGENLISNTISPPVSMAVRAASNTPSTPGYPAIFPPHQASRPQSTRRRAFDSSFEKSFESTVSDSVFSSRSCHREVASATSPISARYMPHSRGNSYTVPPNPVGRAPLPVKPTSNLFQYFQGGTPQRSRPVSLAAPPARFAPQANDGSGTYERGGYLRSSSSSGGFQYGGSASSHPVSVVAPPLVTVPLSRSMQSVLRGASLPHDSARSANQVVRQSSVQSISSNSTLRPDAPRSSTPIPYRTDKAPTINFLQAKPGGGGVIRLGPNQGVVRHLSTPSLQTSGVNVMVATELSEPVQRENAETMFPATVRPESFPRALPVGGVCVDTRSSSQQRRHTSSARESSATSLRQAWESEIQRSQRRSAGHEPATTRRPIVRAGSPVRNTRERPVSVSTNEALASQFGDNLSPDTGDYIRQATEVAETILRSETPSTARAVEQKLRQHSDVKAPTRNGPQQGTQTNGVYRGNAYVSQVAGEDEVGEILQGLQKRMQVLKTELQPARGEVKRGVRPSSRPLVK